MVNVDRDGIFAGQNPFSLARSWIAEAQKSEINDPDAVALATVDNNGMPNVRMVLLRYITKDSFVFFTNYSSVKASEIENSGTVALVFHWKSIRRQLRVRGIINKASPDISDKYYSERGLKSRIGAWASDQSSILENRQILLDKIKEVEESKGDNPKRPEFWGGYSITPLEIEFWMDGENRLHDRFRWERKKIDQKWIINRLFP